LSEQSKNLVKRLEELANQADRVTDVLARNEKIESGLSQQRSAIEDFVFSGREQRMDTMRTVAALNQAMFTGSVQSLNEEFRAKVGSFLDSMSDVKIGPQGQTGSDIKKWLISNDLMMAGATREQADLFAGKIASTEQEKLINELRAISTEEQKAQRELLELERSAAETLHGAATIFAHEVSSL